VVEPGTAVDWREVFKKYMAIVGMAEGVDFLYEDQWTPEEWVEVNRAREEEP